MLICPFCGEDDFDDIGLKNHLLSGFCSVFNDVGIIKSGFDCVSSTTEDQERDINYFRTAPAMERGGGEEGSLNIPEMIDRIKKPIEEAEERR